MGMTASWETQWSFLLWSRDHYYHKSKLRLNPFVFEIIHVTGQIGRQHQCIRRYVALRECGTIIGRRYNRIRSQQTSNSQSTRGYVCVCVCWLSTSTERLGYRPRMQLSVQRTFRRYRRPFRVRCTTTSPHISSGYHLFETFVINQPNCSLCPRQRNDIIASCRQNSTASHGF